MEAGQDKFKKMAHSAREGLWGEGITAGPCRAGV